MDLVSFINSLISRWRLVAIIWVIIFLVSIIYVLLLPDLYRSHGTFIIRPISSIELSEDLVNAIDTLSRRVEINSTYAEIASSRNVKNKVLENLNLSRDDVKNLQIDGNTIPGTNVLEISVIANSPEFASTVAAEVAKETLKSAREIYDVFELELLDDFETPNRPIDSNKNIIIILGIGFGLMAGIVIVFIIEVINHQLVGMQSVQFVNRQTGNYTRSYFDHRLTQEISRSNRNKYKYSLALIKIQNQSADENGNLLQYSREENLKIYASLREFFREEDVIAEYDRDKIGLLIPDLVGEDTSSRIKAIFLQQNSSSKNSDNDLDHPGFAVGIVTVEDHNKDKDELLRLLDQALFLASEEESDGIYLRTDKDNNQTI